MKHELKKLVLFFLMMNLFSSSQEKTCVSTGQCMSARVVMENYTDNDANEDIESEVPLMPISKFILLQY